MTAPSRALRKTTRASGRRTTQPLTADEASEVRCLVAAGRSSRAVAKALGIGRSSVARVLDEVPAQRGHARGPARKRGRPAAADTLRPAHAKARPFSRAWHVQCDRAFIAAMAAAGFVILSIKSLGPPESHQPRRSAPATSGA